MKLRRTFTDSEATTIDIGFFYKGFFIYIGYTEMYVGCKYIYFTTKYCNYNYIDDGSALLLSNHGDD